MTTLGPYRVHPAADAFPLIEGDEFGALVTDIAKHGLREPIVLAPDGETLVDGRNRYRACVTANVEPLFYRLEDTYKEADVLDYIVSTNIKRRHLNAGQLAFVALALEPIFAALAKEKQVEAGKTFGRGKEKLPADRPEAKQGDARDQAAKAVGGSGRGVSKAKKVKTVAPDLADKVTSGQLSLDAAYSKAQGIARDNRQKEPKPDKPKATDDKLALMTHDGVSVLYAKPKGKLTFNETKGDGISWAHWSWNPVTGCLRGCPYCYARSIATDSEMERVYPVGFKPLFHHERLTAPADTKAPDGDDPALRRVFVCSMSDLYGQWVPGDWIEQVHDACAANSQWQYIHLTKNPARYAKYPPPPGSWVGASVDEQKMVRIAEDAARRIDDAAVKWLSVEPMREELRFTDLSMFDWVVIGAQTETYQPDEKGGGRAVHPAFAPPFEWVARIVAQAKEAGCAVHMKPNLLGVVGPRNPGMVLFNEFPSGRGRVRKSGAA